MKKLFSILAFMLIGAGLFAQQPEHHHRLTWALSSGDTLEHKMLFRQLKNLHDASPTTEVEVVCFGPGLDLLVNGRGIMPAKVTEFAGKGIHFIACENTMKDRKVDRSQLLPEATTVPAAIIHLMERQEAGWSYVKAGF
jgi:uncharacterized protein